MDLKCENLEACPEMVQQTELHSTSEEKNQRGILRSRNDSYEIIESLEKGAFGEGFICLKKRTAEKVAVKITTFDSENVVEYYRNERNILRRLNNEDTEKFHFVRALDFFTDKGRGFSVLEILDKSLRDYLKEPLPVAEVRIIMKQLLTALVKLKELCIIHTDIRPENIMMVDCANRYLRIKITGFGSAIQMPSADLPKKPQTISYRAPEVILGLPYSETIDIWSAGCVLAELLLGRILYPGPSEYDVIRMICNTRGVPPEDMLIEAPKAHWYFCKEEFFFNFVNDDESRWILKCRGEYERDLIIIPSETRYREYETGDRELGSLDEIMKLNSDATVQHIRQLSKEDKIRKRCMMLLKRMLAIDGRNRIFVEDCLRHRFFTGFKSWQL